MILYNVHEVAALAPKPDFLQTNTTKTSECWRSSAGPELTVYFVFPDRMLNIAGLLDITP